MKIKFRLLILTLMIALVSIPGVFATWKYTIDAHSSGSTELGVGMESYEWVAPPTANTVVYITSVQTTDGSGSFIINGYSGTYLSSTCTLTGTVYSTVKIAITVYNSSTTDDYAFNAIKYLPEEYDNNEIIHTLDGLQHGDRISKGEYLTFNVTFSYADDADKIDNVLNSVLNFEFIVAEELPEEEEIAVSGALAQFKAILNNVVATDSYKQLTDQMDKNDTNDRYDNSYIGNVSGASELDVELLDDLFGGNLKMNINGEEEIVKAIVKRQNIDNNVNTGDAYGNEMTIYLTTDPLTKGVFERNKTAVVYAAIFTSNDDGENWYQLGDMYQGLAIIKSYNGNTFLSTGGSFDTDTWETKNNTSIADGRTISQVIASLK